jgi:hypothetical protein
MSVRLTHALKAESLPVVCLDARHARMPRWCFGAAQPVLPRCPCCGDPRQTAVEWKSDAVDSLIAADQSLAPSTPVAPGPPLPSLYADD